MADDFDDILGTPLVGQTFEYKIPGLHFFRVHAIPERELGAGFLFVATWRLWPGQSPWQFEVEWRRGRRPWVSFVRPWDWVQSPNEQPPA